MTNKLKVKVRFFSEINGGRPELPQDLLSTGLYRPHLVIGDPHQKRARLDHKNQLLEDYLGVIFVGQKVALVAENETIAELETVYPNVDYSYLVPGATFTIREGVAIVGYGEVLPQNL